MNYLKNKYRLAKCEPDPFKKIGMDLLILIHLNLLQNLILHKNNLFYELYFTSKINIFMIQRIHYSDYQKCSPHLLSDSYRQTHFKYTEKAIYRMTVSIRNKASHTII